MHAAEPSSVLRDRYLLLSAAESSIELQQATLEKCRRDIHFWFQHFCWTFDPRVSPVHQPFLLYPYQVDALTGLCHAIDAGHDLLIEKSRDMGVSWLILLIFQYYWLFRPGSQFLVGSRKLDLVDQKGDLASLFEKLRYNLSWLPQWMHPAGFSHHQHDSALRLINPELGNAITGESGNTDFGRGGRYRAILMDEFPFWNNDAAAYAAAGQSSPSRIVVGTPYGKKNHFARLRFSSNTTLKTLHWQLHPEKDTAWYERQIQRMSPDEIARELDINYNLSISNRVFKGFSETHIRDEMHPTPGRRILRSWDFGYHYPACLFIQLDEHDRVRVLHEIVGHQELLKHFAQRVLNISHTRFADAEFEDVCDPAGTQRSDKSAQTSIDILNSMGVYPFFQRSGIVSGIELIRMQLADTRDRLPALLVSKQCPILIDAFQGGYRYPSTEHELPREEHPYEDVMDCLRYAVVYKCGILTPNTQKPRTYRPIDPHTGY